ncbi:unnamed protein product [Clonostachys rosea]|uniref:CCHC-type domain-containing protein n=1 Tax=Bionectria ochroleuca TaxID=29856 RepID=A0ABY6TTV7_BIOOC|nr:unnamed protein product [Clonostachys rosea]
MAKKSKKQVIAEIAVMAARLRQAIEAPASSGGRNRHHRPKCWNCHKTGHKRHECSYPRK